MVEPANPALDAPFRGLVIIWLALVMGVAAFGVVAWVLLEVMEVSMSTLPRSVLNTAAPLAVMLIAAGLYVGRRMNAGIPRGVTPDEAFKRYQNARIVSLAMCEAGGLAVIVMSLLAGDATWALGGAAVSAWAMILGRPRREDLDRFTSG